MNQQHYFENHVSKKLKEQLIQAIGPIEILRQEEMHQKLINVGKEERIQQAKLACEKRRQKKLLTL
jgi:hypothetical protein